MHIFTLFAEGVLHTLTLGLLSSALSLIAGTALALLRTSSLSVCSLLAKAYVQIFRNVPLTVVFFLTTFGLPNLHIVVSFYQFAILALTLYGTAFVAEALRSGINGIPQQQVEAARSLGFRPHHVMASVVFPLAVRTAIPQLGNVVVLLFRNTSVAVAFGVFETMGAAQALIESRGDIVLQTLAIAAAIYLALSVVIGVVIALIEKHWKIRTS